MKTFSKITIAMITVAGMSTALAQGTPPAKTPPPPAKDAKTPPAPPAKDAKAPVADKKAPEPVKPEAPKGPPTPPAEIGELAKVVTGNWKCTGKAADPMDMTKMVDMKMTMNMKLDMKKWWISGSMKATGKMAFTGQMYVTYDAMAKKWYRTMVDDWGGSEVAWSTGMKDNKVVWEGEGRMPGMGTSKNKTTEEMVSPKNVKMTGQMSMDNGKTWVTGWEADCKK